MPAYFLHFLSLSLFADSVTRAEPARRRQRVAESVTCVHGVSVAVGLRRGSETRHVLNPGRGGPLAPGAAPALRNAVAEVMEPGQAEPAARQSSVSSAPPASDLLKSFCLTAGSRWPKEMHYVTAILNGDVTDTCLLQRTPPPSPHRHQARGVQQGKKGTVCGCYVPPPPSAQPPSITSFPL